MALVAEDCYYDNVPIGDMTGKDKMLEFLGPMFKSKGPLKFEVHRQAATGNVVFNERTDTPRHEGQGDRPARDRRLRGDRGEDLVLA